MNTFFPEKRIYLSEDLEWESYFFGRLCDVFISEIDYRIKPVTAIYERGYTGKLKRPGDSLDGSYIELRAGRSLRE